jgi:chromosome segregation ATPase
MEAVMRNVILTLLAVGLVGGVLLWSGAFGSRGEVAKKKALDKIDDMLGKMEVQKAEIDGGIKAAKKSVTEIRKAKHQAEAELDLIDEKLRPHQDKMARCDERLGQLRDLIKADMPAEFAGKTYSVAELKGIAGKLIDARKECDQKVKGFDTARTSMKGVVATISSKLDEVEARVAKLEASKVKLDAEFAAVQAMKKASAALGDSDATLGENLDELEKKMAVLSREIGGELAGESEKLKLPDTDKKMNEVDAFLKAASSSGDTVSDIDKLIGPAKK